MMPAKEIPADTRCQYENCRNRWTVERGGQHLCSSHTWILLHQVKKTPEVHNAAMDAIRQILPRIPNIREPGEEG